MVTVEFGSIVGLVKLNDVREALAVEFETSCERARPEAKKRNDGSWLIDATIDLESVERALPGIKLGGPENSEYQTLAGFLLKQFGGAPGREPYASGWHASGTMEADTKTDTNEEWRRSSEEWQSFVEKSANLGLNGSDLAA